MTIKETPIIYSTYMVQALLAGRKTQTRRTNNLEIVNKDANQWIKPIFDSSGDWVFTTEKGVAKQVRVKCPYGQPGDLLWVRETWQNAPEQAVWKKHSYKADYNSHLAKLGKWKPSIHMPKDAARIWLKVTNVRVERLKDISKTDALAEGVFEIDKDEAYKDYTNKPGSFAGPIGSFFSLWESIYGADSLLSNPWVWVIDFELASVTGRNNVKEVRA